jgi:hypothetical protein
MAFTPQSTRHAMSLASVLVAENPESGPMIVAGDTRGLLGGRDNPSHLPGTGTKGLSVR